MISSDRIDRRSFLAAAIVGLAAGSLSGGAVARAQSRADQDVANGGYGELVPAGRHLALPVDFRYVAFGAAGTLMSDGIPTPGRHDGMAAFRGGDGLVRLVRNHEIKEPGAAFGPHPYDPSAGGGTTTLVFEPQQGRLLRSAASLTGTVKNCAGGATPWGTWISCEETTAGPSKGFTKPHGYCFEIDPMADGPRPPKPLKAMGRFVHEAVAFDPWGTVYETEDTDSAGFYRFVPRRPGHLAAGGRLQMLAVGPRPNYDTRREQDPDRILSVTWVDINDPDPASGARTPFEQGWDRGGAVFARLEGCCFSRGRVFFTATTGGDAGTGQIWMYRPGPSGGRLRLVFESPAAPLLENPDNIAVSPRGGLVLCEDGPGSDRLLALDPEGDRVFEFARNTLSPSEFAGATSFPGGRWLFVNVQEPGLTLAITGPWRRGCL